MALWTRITYVDDLYATPIDHYVTPFEGYWTGGHVFQLHFSNSTSMIEIGFITETVGRWGGGDIHFGFNVSRVF